MPEIKKIVLTGGPCAGKTTALVKIVEYFSGMGYKVFSVPEVPTLYSTAGWNYLTPNRALYYGGERAILETQLALEDQFMRLAEVCTKPVLIVCDRGALDISAYIKPEEWEEITAMAGTDTNTLRRRLVWARAPACHQQSRRLQCQTQSRHQRDLQCARTAAAFGEGKAL